MNCPSCGNPNPPGAMFCDNCGQSLGGMAPAQGVPPTAPAMGVPPAPVAPMPGAGSTCPQCQADVTPGQAFCENCGFSLVGPGVAGGMHPPAGGAPFSPAPPAPPPPYAPVAAPAPAPFAPSAPVFPQQPPASYGPVMQAARLVMADGSQIQLSGKPMYMMGREDPVSGSFPDVNLEPYGAAPGGVSRQHAKILAQGGYFLVDLNSVNGTFLNKQKLMPNQQMPLNNGDEIRLGKLAMTFHLG